MNKFIKNPDNAFLRLVDEYEKYGKIIVAVDFDGTIHDFHNEGETYEDVIELLKKIEPYAYIVIYSVSNKDRYPYIENYCKAMGIEISSINELPEELNVPAGGKLYYNILLDDRAGLDSAYNTLTKFYNKVHSK